MGFHLNDMERLRPHGKRLGNLLMSSLMDDRTLMISSTCSAWPSQDKVLITHH